MNRTDKIADRVAKSQSLDLKPRVQIPFNTGTRVHPDKTKKYDKSQRQQWKRDLRRYDGKTASRILYYPHRAQSFDYDCGATAVLTVVNFYGWDNEHKVNEQTVFNAIGTDKDGTSNEGIEAGLPKLGMKFENVQSLADIDRHLALEHPVVVSAITYPGEPHYMTLIGNEDGHYIVSDPWSLPISRVPISIFEKVWREDDGSKWGVAVLGEAKYTGGLMEMDVKLAQERQMKTRRGTDTFVAKELASADTLEDTVTMKKIRHFLLDVQDFVFRHRVTNPATVVEVTGKEIEDVKWAVGRALDLT